MATLVPVIYVIDGDPDVRRALARLFRARGEAVETFKSATEFLALRALRRPGCLVADALLPDMSGLELLAQLQSSDDPLPVVFITGFGTIEMGVQAMKNGAIDFLTKPVEEADLLAAIDRGLARDEAAARERSEFVDLQAHFARLTPREREVFALVAKGLLNKQIAGLLGTTEQTVKVHRSRVMQKMGASSLAQLVLFADRLARGTAEVSV
jgi:FixJ family two-component response regulator